MKNNLIIWMLTLLLISVCTAEDEFSIFVIVTTQVLKLRDSVFQMDVRSNWTVGQVIQTLLARTELPIVGIWELRFKHKTLSEEMTLAECGIDAKNADFWANNLVLVEHYWDIESLEEKQPIFRVKHQNPTLKNQELFLQYVRRSEAKHYPFQGRVLFAHFRIVAQVAGGGEFFRFLPSKVPVTYDTAKLAPGLSEQQMWMAYFGSERQSAFSLPVGFIRDGYGYEMPPDRDILFAYFDNELFNPVENRVVFMEVVTGSNAVGNLREMERQDFFKSGLEVHDDAKAQESLMGFTVFGADGPSILPYEAFSDAFQALGMGIADFIASFQGIPPPQNAYCPPYQSMVWFDEDIDESLGQYVMSIKLRDMELYNNVYLLFYFKEGQIVKIERRGIHVQSHKMIRNFNLKTWISDYGKKMLETIWNGDEFEDQWLGEEPIKRAVTQTEDSGVCAHGQVDPMPQFHWDLAALDKKQPIFRVTFVNPEFEDKYGVSKLDVYVQYVRGQDIHDAQNEEFFDQWNGSSNAARKMIEFRILAASTEKNDFFLFEAGNVRPIAEGLMLSPTGTSLFSPRQMDMIRLKLLMQHFLGFTQNLYFPIFVTQLNDVTLPFHQPLPLFYRNGRNGDRRKMAKGSLVTFEEAVFGSDAVPDVRKMEEQDFYDAGWAIRSGGELLTQWLLAKGIPARIVVQIDAFYYYPSGEQKHDDHPVEEYHIESLQPGPEMEHWKLPIKFELKLIPGATFNSFMKNLRSHIFNNDIMDKIPSDWLQNEFKANEPGDLFLSVTPGTDSETLQELQRESIGLELKRDAKISPWICENAAFYFRPDKRKEFVHIVFSVKDWHSVRPADLWTRDNWQMRGITVEDAPQPSMERADFVNVGSAAGEEAVSEDLNTVEGVLQHLGLLDWAAALKEAGWDYDRLATAELKDFHGILLPRRAKIIVNHFQHQMELLGEMERADKSALPEAEELIGEEVAIQPEQATIIRGYLTDSDISAIFEAVAADPEATVRDLHIAARSAGMDLEDRTLTFGGQKLTDPLTLLANLEKSASRRVSVSEKPGHTVEAVLEHLGILDCIDILKKEKYQFQDLPIAEPEDLVTIGLTSKQTRILVFYFRSRHPWIGTMDQEQAEVGTSTRAEVEVSGSEKPGNTVEAVPEEFGIRDCIGTFCHKLNADPVRASTKIELTSELARFLYFGPNHPEVRPTHPEQPEVPIPNKGESKSLRSPTDEPTEGDQDPHGFVDAESLRALSYEAHLELIHDEVRRIFEKARMIHSGSNQPEVSPTHPQQSEWRSLASGRLQEERRSRMLDKRPSNKSPFPEPADVAIQPEQATKVRGYLTHGEDSDMSAMVWNVESLNELEPIFEAELVVPGGENQIVFLKCTHGLENENLSNGMPIRMEMKLVSVNPSGEWVDERSQWSTAQKAVVDYLMRPAIVRFSWVHAEWDGSVAGSHFLHFIKVDLPGHVWVPGSAKDIAVQLPLQCEVPGTASSIVLRRIVRVKPIFVAVDLDPEATVRDLHIAARSAGMDLKDRTLTFGGQRLTDPETLLADLGVSAWIRVSVSEKPGKTVTAVLEHLGMQDCFGILNEEGYELRAHFLFAEPEDFEQIGLTSKQARILVFYFRPDHQEFPQRPEWRLLARRGGTKPPIFARDHEVEEEPVVPEATVQEVGRKVSSSDNDSSDSDISDSDAF